MKLVSLNIERSKHLDRVIPFLQSVRPDAVCLQELKEDDIEQFKQALVMNCEFAPFGLHPKETGHTDDISIVGVGIFSRTISATSKNYYLGNETDARTTRALRLQHLALLSCDVEHDGITFRVITTHFTWAPNGGTNAEQQRDLPAMLDVLSAAGEFVLCGDFNAPRGGDVFSRIAARYTDNIPVEYTTTIDPLLHRAGPLPYVVDGLFSTRGYEVTAVRLQDGVSDHQAIIAHIEKR